MYDATTPVEVDLDPDDGIISISRRGTCLPLTLTEAHHVICRLTGILIAQVPAAAHPTATPPPEPPEPAGSVPPGWWS